MMTFQSQMGTRPEVSLWSTHHIHWLPGQLMGPSHSYHPQIVAPPLLSPHSFCLLALIHPFTFVRGLIPLFPSASLDIHLSCLELKGFPVTPLQEVGPNQGRWWNWSTLGQGSFPSCQVVSLYRVSLLSGLFFNLSSLWLSPLCFLGFLGALLGLQLTTILILVPGIPSSSIPGSFSSSWYPFILDPWLLPQTC